MPEGHVIHRLATALTDRFAGSRLQVTSPQGRFAASAELIDGYQLRVAEAWGKHLFLDLAPGGSEGATDADGEADADTQPEHIVYIHLGLIGTMQFEALSGADEIKGQVRLRISDGVTAVDLRGPQWCRLITDHEKEAAINRLGADPLRADADWESVRARVMRSKRTVASLLMDQKLFAGVGNIYRAETLFRLGIAPDTPGNQLTASQWDAIWADLVELMSDGVLAGRIDTVRPDHMPEAMGRAPRKDDHGGEVYVYRRANDPCYICGTPIAFRPFEGRNLFWCPSCQRR